MKKLLPLLLLLIVLAITGCGGPPAVLAPGCSFSNLVPNATYMVVIINPGASTMTFTTLSSPSGTIMVVTGANCSNVSVHPVTNSNVALSASPSSIDLENPPATVTITGQSFDTTYGMPRIEYFDANGFLVGSTNATSVWGGGTALECYVPNLYQVYSGTYTIRVTNKTSSGYYTHRVGTATITAWNRDRADSDGDGWYDDEDCDPYNPSRYTDCYCGGGLEPITLCP